MMIWIDKFKGGQRVRIAHGLSSEGMLQHEYLTHEVITLNIGTQDPIEVDLSRDRDG